MPTLKKGSKMEAANYRPVTDFGMLQSDGRDNVTPHLDKNSLISSRQHGFVHHKAYVSY